MKALITGVGGQDGHYLSEFLLNKNYQVFGLTRNKCPEGVIPIKGGLPRLFFDETYHLATTFENCYESIQLTINLLKITQGKFFNASTCDLDKHTEYAQSKRITHELTKYYREYKNLHASNGILHHHESPLSQKVMKKIVDGKKRIDAGEINTIRLGDLDTPIDWGHAEDYVEAMWAVLQNPPGDYIIKTGYTYTVRDILEIVFEDYKPYITIDDTLKRPLVEEELQLINWTPKYSFKDLINDLGN